MGKALDWEKIRSDYVTGLDGLRSIAKWHDVSLNDVGRRSSKEGWVEQRKAYRARIEAGTMAKAEKLEIDRNIRHLEVYDKGLAWLESAMQKAKGEADMRAIKDAMAAMKLIQEGQRVALGLDSDQSKQQSADAAKEIVDVLKEALHSEAD